MLSESGETCITTFHFICCIDFCNVSTFIRRLSLPICNDVSGKLKKEGMRRWTMYPHHPAPFSQSFHNFQKSDHQQYCLLPACIPLRVMVPSPEPIIIPFYHEPASIAHVDIRSSSLNLDTPLVENQHPFTYLNCSMQHYAYFLSCYKVVWSKIPVAHTIYNTKLIGSISGLDVSSNDSYHR